MEPHNTDNPHSCHRIHRCLGDTAFLDVPDVRKRRLRSISEPFVIAPPKGDRVCTRLKVNENAAAVQHSGPHLGALAGSDLAVRCAQGKLAPKAHSDSRAARKRSLTAESSSRYGKGVPRREQSIAKRELPTPPCVVSRSPSGDRWTGRPKGSCFHSKRPDWPIGQTPATRWPKTVRGHPPSRTYFCSVCGNGSFNLAEVRGSMPCSSLESLPRRLPGGA